MLMLSIKTGQSLKINDSVTLYLIERSGNVAKFAIKCGRDVRIVRLDVDGSEMKYEIRQARKRRLICQIDT